MKLATRVAAARTTHRHHLAAPLLALTAAACLAQPLTAADPVGQILGKPATTGTIPYMLYLPKSYTNDIQSTYPLVVCLGGVSEVGNGSFTGSLTPVNVTNELPRVLDNGPLRLIQNGVTYFDENPTIVIHPENPDKNYSSATIDATITQVATRYRVDPLRIYVTGYSQGGGGAWLYGKDHGTRLAALVPIAGGAFPANPGTFSAMSGIPVWAIHNAADPTVPAIYTTGTTTSFLTPNTVGWVNGIANGQGGVTQRCLDTYPSGIGFTVVGGVVRSITGVTADRSAHFHPATGWIWSSGTAYVAGDLTQVTLYNSSNHEGWTQTYGSGTSDFNRPFWTWLLGQRKGQVPSAFGSREVIVDNTETTHTSANGTWPVTTGAASSFLGGYATPGTGSTFTFTPVLPATTTYDVYVWYSAASGVNLSTVVPVTVHANGVDTTVIIDEAYGAGHWVLIGTYACGSGTGSSVTFATTGANGIVSVDAVRFVEAPTSASNTPPTISVIGNQTVVSGATVTPTLTIGDAQTQASNLTVQAISDNATLIPASGLLPGGSGASRTLAITPAAGLIGTANIIVTVTDAEGLAITTSFRVTVNTTSGNTPPTIGSTIPAQTIALNGASAALAFTVGDAETAAAALVVTRAVSSTPSAYLPLSGVVLGGSGTNRTVTVTPAAGQSGNATVTITVTDAGGLATVATFTVTTPAPPNIAPTITLIADLALPVSGHSSALPFTITDDQTAVTALTVSATTSLPAYLPLSGLVFGGSGANRTLTITPASGQSGTSTVSVTVRDGAGLTGVTTFTVTSSAATGPTISPISNMNITGGATSPPVSITVTDPTVASVTLIADVAPSGSLSGGDFAFTGTTGSRSMVIVPSGTASGSYQVTVTATDANALTATSTFTVVVTPASSGSTPPPASSGGGGGGGGCGLGTGAYALAGLLMLMLRAIALVAAKCRD